MALCLVFSLCSAVIEVHSLTALQLQNLKPINLDKGQRETIMELNGRPEKVHVAGSKSQYGML